MHPSLYYFSCYSWHTLLESEETTIKFMQEVGLIPSMSSPCPVCGAETRVNQTPEKIRFPLRLLDTPYGKMHRNYVIESVKNWRAMRGERTISNESVVDFYSYFREVAEVFASKLGGPVFEEELIC
ncbi:hypothetical protein CEXT_649031 [Caerostris extrusa]|uniref:Transposase n=1 Tax=Caerostris extrusa TaxID=172846 RepID=A0AAV4SYR8_CAEEX|nr:hypothetical protein CEXT_649031 [Caerostris extrusa]